MSKAKWNEQCWSCGSRHMVDQGDFARCEYCGATATPLFQPGPFPLLCTKDDFVGDSSPSQRRGNSPSPALVRKIELERSQKSAQGTKR